MKNKQIVPRNFDVIIAGAGVAGVLTANRISHASQKTTVALLDLHPSIGGKLRSTEWSNKHFSCGMETISSKLFEFIKNSWSSSPKGKTTAIALQPVSSTIGILSGGKLQKISTEELISEKGARYLVGANIRKEWGELNKIISNDPSYEVNIHKIISRTKKTPAAVAANVFCHTLGIPSTYHTSLKVVKERFEYTKDLLYQTNWETALQKFVNQDISKNIHFFPQKIITAVKEKNNWQIDTLQETFTCKKLIVAHSPWESIEWLEKKETPQAVLNVALKTRPVSQVVLNKQLTTEVDLPSTIIIVSEQVTAHVQQHCITFSTFIDYEQSTDALAVVKAIKRLKRSFRKLSKYCSTISVKDEHVALYPIGWAQCIGKNDHKMLQLLNDYKYYSDSLAFCGESYGSSYNPDSNLIKSVLAASLWFTKSK